MGIIRISALLILLFVIIGGCNDKAREEKFEYWDEGFECEIFWKEGGSAYRSILSAGEIKEGKRDISILFSEPDTLVGVTAELIDGKTRISLRDITLENVKLSGIFDIAEFFENRGRIVSSESLKVNGESRKLLYIEDNDGKKREIYISDDGVPQKICGSADGRQMELEVIWFKERGE